MLKGKSIINSVDRFGFKFLFIFFLISVTFTRYGLDLDNSTKHNTFIYLDSILSILFLIIAVLFNLYHKIPFNFGVIWPFIPILILSVWWLATGILSTDHPIFFLVSIYKFFLGFFSAVIVSKYIVDFQLSNYILKLFAYISVIGSVIGLLSCVLDPTRFMNNPSSIFVVVRVYYGMFMLLSLVVCYYLLTKNFIYIGYLGLFSSIIGVIISGSRAAQIGAIIWLLAVNVSKINFKKIVLLLLLCGIFVLGISKINSERMEGEHGTKFQVNKNIAIDASTGNRMIMWINAWSIISSSSKNFLIGTGFTSYRWVYNKYLKLPFYTNAAHNSFLHVWAESGLVGLILYLLIFLLIILFIFKNSNEISIRNNLLGLKFGVFASCFTQESLLPQEVFANFNTLYFLILGIFLNEISSIQKYEEK